MTAIEKLARRICWLEFGRVPTRQMGVSEVGYWRGLPRITKDAYLRDARYWARMSEKLTLEMVHAAQRELTR